MTKGANEKSVEAPMISVIMSAYNCENSIDECIESIVAQTYENWEFIICDDGSTDGTYEKLKTWEKREPRIRVLKNEKNLKQAASRNRCISVAKGVYILIQDADDLSERNRMEKLLNSFEPEYDFIGSFAYLFNENGCYGVMKRPLYPKVKDFYWIPPYVCASMLFRIECLKKVEGYRVSKYTQRGEDYDLLLRLYAAGYQGKNIPDKLYGYRVDQNNYGRRTFRARLDECVIRYQGFRENRILFPFGWLYVLKPIPAHIIQTLRNMGRERK